MKSVSITLFFIILFTIACLPVKSQDASVSPPLGGVLPLATPTGQPSKNAAPPHAEGRVVSVAAAGVVAAVVALF